MKVTDFMSLAQAWAILGRDVGTILATVSNLPRNERVAATEKILDRARRIAAKISAKHHPDVGGDPEKFREVWEALRVIEFYTSDFKSKMEELERRHQERIQSMGTFIEMKK